MIDLAWLATLLQDPAYGSFARGLALGRRFQFCVLFGGPEGTAAALLLLEKQVAALRRRPVAQVVIFQGAVLERERSGAGLGTGTTIAEVMERLVQPAVLEEGTDPLFVLDASLAPEEGSGVWLELFERMNQHRNLIAATLPATLLLCLPPALEARFAQAAPDLWSIRGGVLCLPGEGRPERGSPLRPLQLVYFAAPEDADLVAEFEQHLAPLARRGLLRPWSERQARPGELLDVEMDRRLGEADVVLFFLSPGLLRSLRYEGLMERALARGLLTIPVLLRPVLWAQTPLGERQPVPPDRFIGDYPPEVRPAVWNRCLSEILRVFGYNLGQSHLGRDTDPELYFAEKAYDRGREEGWKEGMRVGRQQALRICLEERGLLGPEQVRPEDLHRCKDGAQLAHALQLAAAGASAEEIRAALGVDSPKEDDGSR